MTSTQFRALTPKESESPSVCDITTCLVQGSVNKYKPISKIATKTRPVAVCQADLVIL